MTFRQKIKNSLNPRKQHLRDTREHVFSPQDGNGNQFFILSGWFGMTTKPYHTLQINIQ